MADVQSDVTLSSIRCRFLKNIPSSKNMIGEQVWNLWLSKDLPAPETNCTHTVHNDGRNDSAKVICSCTDNFYVGHPISSDNGCISQKL